MKSVAFHVGPKYKPRSLGTFERKLVTKNFQKITQSGHTESAYAFWVLLKENVSPKTFKNHSIWSH